MKKVYKTNGINDTDYDTCVRGITDADIRKWNRR